MGRLGLSDMTTLIGELELLKQKALQLQIDEISRQRQHSAESFLSVTGNGHRLRFRIRIRVVSRVSEAIMSKDQASGREQSTGLTPAFPSPVLSICGRQQHQKQEQGGWGAVDSWLTCADCRGLARPRKVREGPTWTGMAGGLRMAS